MKRAARCLLINLAVLAGLLAAAEAALALAGVPTLHRLAGAQPRMKRLCAAMGDAPLEVFDAFVSDAAAIFHANPHPGMATRARWRQQGVVINRAGFRGNEFEPAPAGRPTLLLIGDSFTWGASARPITKSFADLLQEGGYHVYNGGIPGTDVGQYARVAAAWVPRLRPAAVAVCLWEGNDFSNRPMPARPNRQLQYSTRIGFIKGYDVQGRYFADADEAVAYLRAAVCGRCRTPREWLHYRTRLGRAVDRLLRGSGPFANRRPDRSWIRRELLRIQETCRLHGSDFVVLLIPSIRQSSPLFKKKRYLHLLAGMPHFLPEDLERSDYCTPPDNHFNNQGHLRFAGFARRVLESRGLQPPARAAGTGPAAGR